MISVSRNRLRCILSAATLLVAAGCAPKPTGPPPKLPANFAVRPLVTLKDGREIQAGTIFATTTEPSRPPILLTALHLFGEGGGLEADIPASVLPDQIGSVYLFDMQYEKELGTAGRALLREGYPLRNEGSTIDCSGDLVAFELPNVGPLGVRPLAARNPAVGERVWIVGLEYTAKGSNAELFAGTVSEVSPKVIAVEQEQPFEGRGFSGGPVVNARGEVVGTVIGGVERGKQYMLLNPVARIRERLRAAGLGG